MPLHNCSVSTSKMATMAAIFATLTFRNALISKMATMAAILATLTFRNATIVLFWLLRWPPWLLSWQHGHSEILQLLCSVIQDGHHGSYLDNMYIQKCYNCSVLTSKMATKAAILATWTFRNATIVLFWLLRWPPWLLSCNMDIQKFYNCSVLLSKMATMAAILATWTFRNATIVLFCYPRWPPWQLSGQHGHSEMLQLFCSDIQDGHHGSFLGSMDIQKCYSCSTVP